MKTNKRFLLFWLFIPIMVWAGCDKTDELSYKGLDTSPGYFVECYLTSGDVYKLSATRISPISEDYILDYSADFDVTIDSVQLYHSLYSEDGSNYIYNFGNANKFNPSAEMDTVRLQVINSQNDTLRSFTTVPDAIMLHQAVIENDNLKISIKSSGKAFHDYYLLKIDMLKKNGDTSEDLKFYDLTNSSGESSELVIGYRLQDKPTIEALKIELFRVTESNYRYQLSLWNAVNANNDNLVFPNPLDGNIENGIGIFTCFSKKELKIEL
ncbi:DUF4249 family protein [Marinilabilia sp.]